MKKKSYYKASQYAVGSNGYKKIVNPDFLDRRGNDEDKKLKEKASLKPPVKKDDFEHLKKAVRNMRISKILHLATSIKKMSKDEESKKEGLKVLAEEIKRTIPEYLHEDYNRKIEKGYGETNDRVRNRLKKMSVEEIVDFSSNSEDITNDQDEHSQIMEHISNELEQRQYAPEIQPSLEERMKNNELGIVPVLKEFKKTFNKDFDEVFITDDEIRQEFAFDGESFTPDKETLDEYAENSEKVYLDSLVNDPDNEYVKDKNKIIPSLEMSYNELADTIYGEKPLNEERMSKKEAKELEKRRKKSILTLSEATSSYTYDTYDL